MRTLRVELGSSEPRPDLPWLRRNRPRAYEEWRALYRWGRLPTWEETPAGYLLRFAREAGGFTQKEMARRLGCSQQAVAQAERWQSNPTVRFLRRWCRAARATSP